MNKTFFLTGIVLGTTGVLFGAFGSHSLKTVLSQEALETFKIANTYQMYHAFFFLVISGIKSIDSRRLNIVYRTMLTGISFFSGSLYFISLREAHGIEISFFGLITPAGGLLIITAWIMLGYFAYDDLKGKPEKE